MNYICVCVYMCVHISTFFSHIGYYNSKVGAISFKVIFQITTEETIKSEIVFPRPLFPSFSFELYLF